MRRLVIASVAAWAVLTAMVGAPPAAALTFDNATFQARSNGAHRDGI